MIKLIQKNKEIDITLEYEETIGSKPYIIINGRADLHHHLIEGCFDILDKLARMSGVNHNSREWKNK